MPIAISGWTGYIQDMSITFSPTLHPSEHGTEADEIYLNLNDGSARTFVTNLLGREWDESGTIVPAEVLYDWDNLLVMAAALDVVDDRVHAIDNYWSFRLAEFMDVCRWADRKGRDILWG